MINYGAHFSTLKTPQTQPASLLQKPNNAGGYAFTLSPFDRLDRWLILGTEGGSYYATERAMTVDNAKTIQECLTADGLRTVRRIREISVSGRAPKNDPAIFALAMAAGHSSPATRLAALDALSDVCRTGTHLFTFLSYVKGFRGWGRGLRKAVGKWYLSKKPDQLAYQLLKYQQRNGMSHRDVLRLSHPLADDAVMNGVLRYAVGKETHESIELPTLLEGYELVKKATTEREVIDLVVRFPLSHEMIPTQFKTPMVWEVLLHNNRVPLGALLRNLGVLTANGAIAPLSRHAKLVSDRLTDVAAIKKARIHPFNTLVAMRTYARGHGDKGKLKWSPVRDIVDALDAAFYAGFEAIEPTGANTLLALDVSGSMGGPGWGSAPLPGGLTPREAAAAMAMVTMRTEKHFHTIAFTAAAGRYPYGQNAVTDLAISPRQRLDDVIRATSGLPFGSTDVALPMLYALERRLDVDTFVVYTDNESYAGNIHPHQALVQYRRKTGKQHAKLIVVGMTATEFTVADPNDLDSLNVVGFDTAAPALIADFSRKES